MLIDGGGIDGGNGFTVASNGDDLHAIGSTAPLFPGYVGCVVIGPDKTRRMARIMPDPAGGVEAAARYCAGDVAGERGPQLPVA